jgi:phosphohistidine phosphatase
MNVYLVQHAKAMSETEDPDRPLSEAGRAELTRIVAFLAKQPGFEVARIWNSGKTRAAQTAEILADELHPPLGVRTAEGLNPSDDPAIWAARLSEMSYDVMLVGHMPHLRRLAGRLLTGESDQTPVKFENAGVVCLAFNGQGWSLDWAIVPRILP